MNPWIGRPTWLRAPVASETFMEDVEDLPVQEREP